MSMQTHIKTFTPARPIWCAGCGDFAVQGVLEKSLHKMGIPPHKLMLLAGIGCSGTIQNNLPCYGYHALHGRVLPAAIGAKLANPDMTVIAAGGDGDGYAIGAGHLVHTFKSNPSIMYIVMNNSNYGLTKGQFSATAETGLQLKKQGTNPYMPIDLCMEAVISNATFVARSAASSTSSATGVCACTSSGAKLRQGASGSSTSTRTVGSRPRRWRSSRTAP